MRLIVAIPTTNRCAVAVATVSDLARQSRLPDLVVIVTADESDFDVHHVENSPFKIDVIQSERGLTTQRNVALSLLQKDDVMLFLDDDFLLAPDYLEALERLFLQHSDVAMVTGNVLADGIHGPGFTHEYGRELVATSQIAPHQRFDLRQVYNCYGCNMALRARPVVENQLRFDERLKAYCWLEDVDFSRQMARFGTIVQCSELRGVHLGTKTGRSSGLSFGYSQIANPLYLLKKGTMSAPRAINILGRNLISNVVKSLKPEAEVDRRGRLRGNFCAFLDMIRGRISPERILDIR